MRRDRRMAVSTRRTISDPDSPLSPILQHLPHAPLATLPAPVDHAPHIYQAPSRPFQADPLDRYSSLVLGSRDGQIARVNSENSCEVLEDVLGVSIGLLKGEVDVGRVGWLPV
jgi:hypothetical protein